MSQSTRVRIGPRQRTTCPDCGREVAFVTNLRYKYLARHKKPGTRSFCVGRRVALAP